MDRYTVRTNTILSLAPAKFIKVNKKTTTCFAKSLLPTIFALAVRKQWAISSNIITVGLPLIKFSITEVPGLFPFLSLPDKSS